MGRWFNDRGKNERINYNTPLPGCDTWNGAKIARLGSRPPVIGGTEPKRVRARVCVRSFAGVSADREIYGRADRMTDDGTSWATERWLARRGLTLAHVSPLLANTYPPPPYPLFLHSSFIHSSLSISLWSSSSFFPRFCISFILVSLLCFLTLHGWFG